MFSNQFVKKHLESTEIQAKIMYDQKKSRKLIEEISMRLKRIKDGSGCSIVIQP